MSRWFRLYADAMRNPKVASLSDREFRLWVELLAVASEQEGLIPPLSDLKHMLKRRLDHLSTGVERLISIGLIDALEGGYAPHNWSKRQYKSDVSTERVRKHRAERNVSETPPDTETDTETDIPLANANGPMADPKKAFWDFSLHYLGQSKRSQVGKWCSRYGQEETAAAITAAQIAGAVEPVAYIERTLRRKKEPEEVRYTGP